MAATWLMIATAIVTVGCCVAAGRVVPWQGRQVVWVMAAAMLGMAVTGKDPGVSLLCGVVLLASAMLGTIGLRGTAASTACCHRSFGSVVMAVCAFAGLARERGDTGIGHASHGGTDAVAVLGATGVLILVVWTIVDFRRVPRRERLGAWVPIAESWAMTAGVILMWSAH